MKIVIARRGTPVWLESASLVSKVFGTRFGAQVAPNPDQFIAYVGQQDGGPEEVEACIGISFPENGPIFLERYLDGTIEDALCEAAEQEVRRHQIVQLGSVASLKNMAGAEIYRALPLIQACLGRSYAVMTMTNRSAALAKRLGLITHRLCDADGTRLGAEELARWGTFYDQRPAVRWGRLADHSQQLVTGVERYALDSVDIRLLSRNRTELTRAA
ncbi:thermostable hemolysin [Streptomyces sp. NPDC057302]|uniref:thermostable hemolysin n=1 Tax=Streptomyces sp. NPDC057302 TaxID=3346094 RepID=UPI003626BE66